MSINLLIFFLSMLPENSVYLQSKPQCAKMGEYTEMNIFDFIG